MYGRQQYHFSQLCYYLHLSPSLALGYLSKFDSGHVTAWGSGYGLAGLLGALLYVVFGKFYKVQGARFCGFSFKV